MTQPFIGEVRIFAGNYAPNGWALCNGQVLPISQNTALFSLIGTYFGGNGSTTFQLPDLQGRSPLHAGSSAGSGLTPRVIGETGGSPAVTLLTSELPQHTHTLRAAPAASTTVPSGLVALAVTGGAKVYGAASNLVPMGAGLQVTGNNVPHENRQPYLGVSFIIALTGIYPSRG